MSEQESISDPPPRSENVIYIYDPEYSPAVQYYSLPSRLTGGADTLSEARCSFRSAMADRAGIGNHELPAVVEHQEAVIANIWVRTRIGGFRRSGTCGDTLRRLLRSESDPALHQLNSELDSVTDRGLRPVVVVVEPDEPIAAVATQMASDDALWLAFTDCRLDLAWLAIYGPDADTGDGAVLRIEDIDLPAMAIGTLFDRYALTNGTALQLQ